MENNTFTVKNFRTFDETGTTFKLKPITLLTGQNGSGKSTLTKAVMLMHDFFTKVNPNTTGFNPISQELDFTRPSLKLGGFSVEKNFHSISDTISFGYSVQPKVAAYLTLDVEYSFKNNNEGGVLYNNGIFNRVTIRHQDKTLINICQGERSTSNLAKSELFNISNFPFLISFCVFCIGMNLQWIQMRQDEYKGSSGNSTDDEGYDSLERAKESFLQLAQKLPRPFSTLLFSEYQYYINSKGHIQKDLLLDLTASNSFILNPEIIIELNRFLDERTFFFFDVFKELDKKTKDEVANDLRRLNHHNASHVSKEAISEFLNGDFHTVSEYFSSLEKDMLSNMSGFDLDSVMRGKYEIYQKVYLGGFQNFDKLIPELLDIKYTSFTKEPTCKFQWLYDCLCQMELQDTRFSSNTHITTWEAINPYSPNDGIGKFAKHKLYSAYTEYLSLLLTDVVNPIWLNRIFYFGDAHSNVQRIHSLSDKNDIVVSRVTDYLQTTRKSFTLNLPEEQVYLDVLQRQLVPPAIKKSLSEEQMDKFCHYSFLDYWISELGIGEKVLIDLDKDKMSLSISIEKENNRTVLLADEGYGIYQIVLLLLSIETELKRKGGSVDFYNSSLLFGTYSPTTIILEEPEANLHPAFQTKIAQILYDAYQRSGGMVNFIVETHSEYLIRATQAIVANTVNDETELEKIPFVVYYIERGGKAYDMEYQVSGRFNKPFGTGFFDEAGKSSLEIIRKERRMADGKDA